MLNLSAAARGYAFVVLVLAELAVLVVAERDLAIAWNPHHIAERYGLFTLIVFTAWWLYLAVPIQDYLVSNRQDFLWGYGHYLVFASAAAMGAGTRSRSNR